ncbi:HEPN domain-containing protein [Actinophytocola oryzae]|uniref:RiboL-PSP-HEPN domain-containing protein n=1 Tax=Actinophytocola oryzae TaxID=502181 RepID=A0A4R7VTC7_9PSEU|nr:HEPN domain-containing protein [Actinophytocola oryzae]TDV52467.1 hypothetical protein CLV71_105599 [Actinophytocola oryzae]
MTAIDDFKSSLDAVHALIALEDKLQDPPAPEQRAASDGLRGSVVVLTLACFEGFLQTLFEEQLDRIVQAKIPLANYNDSLRVSAVFNSLEYAHKGDVGNQQKRPERIPTSIMIARTVGAGGFSPRALSSTKSNPNSETVSNMFSAVGRKSAWNALQASFVKRWHEPVIQTFCKDKLDELVRSRNQVAHTAVSNHIVRSYLTETAAFIDALGEAALETLDSHIESCISMAQTLQQAGSAAEDDWASDPEG